MANTPKPKSSLIDDVLAFVTDKKKLPLLLLLLGGTATVVTTAVVLSNPGSGASSSQGGNSASQGGSTGPISGNEVPDLDLENPTLSADNNGMGASFDFLYFSRFQNDYYLQTGLNYFEGATPGEQAHTENVFAIYNFRTGEIIFEYTFEYADAYRSGLIAGTENNYNGNLRVAFDGASTIYVLVDTPLPSTIGGTYSAMRTHATTKFTSIYDYERFQFLLAFDIEDTTSYTIIDSLKVNYSDFEMNDILYENDQLYVASNFSKSYLENSGSRNDDLVFNFMTVPTEIPTLTVVSSNQQQRIGYLTQVSVEGTTLEVIDHSPIASNYNVNLWFQGYRQGFETRYFTEEGSMVLTANFWNNQNSNALDIPAFFDNLETTFLEDNATVLSESETKIIAAYDAILDTPNGDSFTSHQFNLNFNGFYNFETGILEDAYTGYNVWTYNYNGGQEQRAQASSWPTLFLTDSGDSFIIENESLREWESDGSLQLWSEYNPEYLVSAVSTVYRYNIETGEKTLVIENDNNGTVITGVYEKSDGYYLTGSYYETDTNEVSSVDAFLRATNDAFVTQQELVLSGSKDDIGQLIMLDGSGRPVWIVMSNSIDGDFAGLGGVENRFTTYSVSF